MTISSSFNASVTGLAANSSRLAAISDNIANSNTPGYKRAVTEFHSLVIDGNGGKYTAGGVRSTSTRLIDEEGTLISTNNSTDLAVRGSGFIPVTTAASLISGSQPMNLATTGSFRPDADGYLVSAAGNVLLGWQANPDGTIPAHPRDVIGGLEPVQIQANLIATEPTTAIGFGINLPATDTIAGAAGTPYELTIQYYDNLGTGQTIRAAFTPTVPATGTSNEWTMVMFDDAQGGAVIGAYTLTFDDTRGNGGTLQSVTQPTVDAVGNLDVAGALYGNAYDPLTGMFQVSVAGGPIDVTIGQINDPSGVTQLSDSFAPNSITADGFPAGSVTAIEVDRNGFLHATFDNGFTRTLYQIPVVDMPNPNGLVALNNQTYSLSVEAGPFFMWDAGDGPTGEIIGFAMEESTTDVAGELTRMIQTQRAYSSNAKVIQTVDEMLQETTNIIR